jgi:hypothetical protein
MSGARAATFFKATAIPVAAFAAVMAMITSWVYGPFGAFQPLLYGNDLRGLAWTSLLLGTISGWLFLWRRLQIRMALVLLVPYLAVVTVGCVAIVVAVLFATGDSL